MCSAKSRSSSAVLAVFENLERVDLVGKVGDFGRDANLRADEFD